MSHNFLKVNDDWTLIIQPSESDKFMLNVCGLPIHIAITDKFETTEKTYEFPFTIGGPISQMHVDQNQYVYAKAIRNGEPHDAFIVIDNKRISLLETVNLTTELEALATEIMKLINRVSGVETKHLNLYYSMVLFLQRYQTDQFKNAIAHTDLSTAVMQLSSRLYAAERLIGTLRQDFTILSFKMDDILEGETAEKLSSLETDLAIALASIERVNERVDTLIKELEEGGQATLEFKELIKPYEEEIDDIRNDFNDLNNALILLTQKHSPPEITDAFDTLINLVDDDMKKPVSAIKQIALELSENEILDRTQDEELDTKIAVDDSLIISPSFDLLKRL